MMSMKRLLLLVVSLMISVEIYANGDPVVRLSSINRVANPEPLSISEICITHERINITHVDGYNCFDITYTLKNKSDRNFPEIHYGFPIDYSIADEFESYRFTSDYYTESIGEIGWNERLIKDIQFAFNDSLLPFHSSKESVREAGFVVEAYDEYIDSIPVDAVNRRWFYTSFAMQPQSEAKLNVRYKVYANSSLGIYTDRYNFSYFARRTDGDDGYIINLPYLYRYFSNRFDILYDFTPAKHFGNGAPYVIDVNIDLSNLDNPWIETPGGYQCYVNRIERSIYVSAGDIKPIDIKVNFNSDRSEKNLERIIDQFQIPETYFQIETTGDSVSIEFNRPMFVTDLACYIDSTVVRSVSSIIEYADGTKKRYNYEPYDLEQYINNDSRVKTPILLAITDFYYDGMIWSENSLEYITHTKGKYEDKFKIKSIKLYFNTVGPQVTVCKGIKVIDARFIK